MSRRVLALAFAIILTAGYVSVLPSQVAAGPSAAVGSIEESGDLEDGHLINGHGTGLIPSERTLEEREVSLAAGESEMPSSVDLSEEEHFPPVGDQGNQGSCAAWALGYYAQGYLEAKDRGWDASEGRPEHLLSPAWAYNMANRGVDNGSTLEGVGKVIVDWGIPSMAAMPYDQDDHTSWGDQGAFREAPMHRADDVHEIAFDSQVVSSIKDLVSDGVPVTFGIDANQYPNDFDDGNYILSSEEYQSDEVNHAQTIVGYDDAVTDDGEEGAFRVVNSWGTDFAEDGYYWLTYDALEGIGENSMPTYIEDRPDYDPEMLSVWHFDDPPTRDVDIEAGVGDPTAPEDTREPFYVRSEYDELRLPTFMCLDVTSFADDHQAGEEDFFLTVDNASDPRTLSSFRMEAYEGYAPGEADRGSIQSPDVPEEVPATVSTELGLHDPITLEEGLDREVSLRSQGQAEWLGTRDHSVRGGDSVRSGDVGDSGSSGLSLQVEGPASLSFSWKVSSQEDADLLRLRVDGSLQASISGKVDWKRESVDLGPGGHEIEWVYEKDGSISGGADCGWVDALSANSVTVVEEGFEEGFPDDLEAMDEDDGSGEDYWGVSTARSHTGDASLWCAQEGTSSVNGEPNEENGYYDQEMNASLYLSIDLEGYDSAGLSFLHWTETGQGDSLSLWINDGDWDRAWVGENTDGWETVNLSVPTSATELRWVFESDQGVEEHEGSYLDDLMLTGKDT
ncbi:MAG: C1 family peptidase, partial [Methanomassiliicoccales archaeon]